MDITEQFYMSTVQIISHGQYQHSSGTGFFFQYDEIGGKKVDVIVTNKHIVTNFNRWTFNFRSKADHSIIPVDISNNSWLIHDTEDLAMLPMSEIYRQNNKLDIYSLSFTKKHIPPKEYIDNMSCIEDIFMVGYPDAIIDKYNNLPIIRKGITATPVKYNYQGKPEFLIDATIYGGSSGSPVFIFNKDYLTEDGKQIKPQVILLGISHAVHLHELCNTDELQMRIPNGLGFVIKSPCLWDMKPALEHFIGSADNHNQGNGK